jgi:dipicolinate synthase subunit B
MAAKAHLRNGRPLLIAVSTNDGLSGNAENIGTLLNRKNVYFVPFYQDNPMKKPNSIVADFDLIPEAIDAALSGQQIQPLLRIKNSE